MAQALAGLKLVTIARGFDEDFDDLHPKRLRRFHVGPMYSSAFTEQTGPLRQVLEDARSPQGARLGAGLDRRGIGVRGHRRTRRDGFRVPSSARCSRSIRLSGRGAETGAPKVERSIILPQRPFQALEERNPPGFGDVRKFVVSKSRAGVELLS